MEIILGAFGVNITMGLVSGVTSAANGVYTLIGNIYQSTSSGSYEIKKLIRESDLENKVKAIQLLLNELTIDDNTPQTLIFCLQTIKDSIKDITEELERIHYRITYNNNLWFSIPVRRFKFDNCKDRLLAHLKNLDSRYNILISIISIESKITKKSLSNDLTNEKIHENIKFIQE